MEDWLTGLLVSNPNLVMAATIFALYFDKPLDHDLALAYVRLDHGFPLS